jgi:hypothetical protein
MAEVDPIIIDIKHPGACQFCRNFDNKTKALLMPWRQNEGWWSCIECKDKATKRMQTVMNSRRIMGISAFPDWFRQHGLFAVQRSDQTLAEMFLVDFECEFSNNIGNAGNSEGRVRLSNQDIFVDMCTPDNKFFKQVSLCSLYENNSSLLAHGIITFSFPSYVSVEAQQDWQQAADKAYYGKKNLPVLTENVIEAIPPSFQAEPALQESLQPPVSKEAEAELDAESIVSQSAAILSTEHTTVDNTVDATVILQQTQNEFRFW